MNSNACAHCEMFHYGVHQGDVFEKMMTPQQRDEVFDFFRDSFLERLDTERGLDGREIGAAANGWYKRFNSVGLITPRIDLLWNPWWNLETPGRAVAALEYCSGLMYLDGNNPLFGVHTPEHGGGGPHLWANDSSIDAGWTQENLDFLRANLTVEFVNEKVAQAVERLEGEPEWETARQVECDLSTTQERMTTQDVIESRVWGLPHMLSGSTQGVHTWAV